MKLHPECSTVLCVRALDNYLGTHCGHAWSKMSTDESFEATGSGQYRGIVFTHSERPAYTYVCSVNEELNIDFI
jgi:hypothetical protein